MGRPPPDLQPPREGGLADAQTQRAQEAATRLTPYTSFIGAARTAHAGGLAARRLALRLGARAARARPRAAARRLDLLAGRHDRRHADASSTPRPPPRRRRPHLRARPRRPARSASATPPGSVPTFTLGGCATSQSEVALTLQRLRLIDGVSKSTLQSSTKPAPRRAPRRAPAKARAARASRLSPSRSPSIRCPRPRRARLRDEDRDRERSRAMTDARSHHADRHRDPRAARRRLVPGRVARAQGSVEPGQAGRDRADGADHREGRRRKRQRRRANATPRRMRRSSSLGKAVPASEEVPSLIYQLAQASNQKHVEFSSISTGANGAGASAPSSSAATVAGTPTVSRRCPSRSSSTAASSSSPPVQHAQRGDRAHHHGRPARQRAPADAAERQARHAASGELTNNS